MGDNTPIRLLRGLSLSNLKRDKPGARPPAPAASKSAPLLPELDFGSEDQQDQDDMNGLLSDFKGNKTANGSPPASIDRTAMPPYTSPRNTAGPLAIDSTVMAPDPNPANVPWARSNAHAPPHNSKTSQYIDRITSENERLKREIKFEKLAREEEAKRVSAARSKAEDSRAEHQHLQVLADTNARAIDRKDRKIEELKAALETEVRRRKIAEQRADEALKMLGDTRSETQRQLAAAYEQKHLAETNADAAREGYKRIMDSLEKKLKLINEELRELRNQRIEDADKIRRQAIISEQLQHETARKVRTEDKMVDMMGTYKREHRKEMDALIEEAERMRAALPEKEKEAAQLVEALKETRDKMMWVMAQQQRQGS